MSRNLSGQTAPAGRSPEAAAPRPSAVNPTLTADGPSATGPTDEPGEPAQARKRAERVIEPTDFAAMMRRMLAAHGRRVADADVEDLAELIELRDALDEAIAYAIRESRARYGRSWSDIARAAGITKQAAQQRWGQR